MNRADFANCNSNLLEIELVLVKYFPVWVASLIATISVRRTVAADCNFQVV